MSSAIGDGNVRKSLDIIGSIRFPVLCGKCFGSVGKAPLASSGQLAREIGLSRSALADRFMHFVGQPQMHSLAQRRTQVAGGVLSSGAANIAAIARDVG